MLALLIHENKAALLGPALAPPVGGFVSWYFSWRVMQFSIAAAALLALLAMSFLMPETSQPKARGVDKLEEDASKVVFLNPFKDLELLRSPNVLATVSSCMESVRLGLRQVSVHCRDRCACDRFP
jgi:predicted MFS family arabinose efflux permease